MFVLPAHASAPTLRLSGRGSGFADVTLGARLSDLPPPTLTGGKTFVGFCLQSLTDLRIACAVKVAAAAYPSDPSDPITFSTVHDFAPGRYRAFLIADGQASASVRWPGKSVTYSRLTPTRAQVTTGNLATGSAPAVAGLTRLPIVTRDTTVVMSGLRWESTVPVGVVRLNACLVPAGQVCEQDPSSGFIDNHIGGAASGSYTQFYDAEGQQRLATSKPDAVADILSGDHITFARSYVIALDAAG